MESPLADSPSLAIDGHGTAWITFDDPERATNVLTEGVMRRLAQVLEKVRGAARAGDVRVVVVRSGKEGSFITGADVDDIAGIEDPEEGERKVRLGQAVFMDVESLPVPTVAAVHGTCLGGGAELALACTHRLLSDAPETEIRFPEVQLGILPAWGGTTRLPRLVGLRDALPLLLQGKALRPPKARRIGFAGAVLPAELFEEEVADFAVEAPDLPYGASRPRRGLVDRLVDDTLPGRLAVLAAARRRVLDATGGHYPAPLAILDLLRRHLGGSVEASLDAEARAASHLLVSPVCKNLVHVYRMRQRARKAGSSGIGEEVTPAPVERLGVVGAGVMGGGVAQLAAYHDIPVRMKDIAHEEVARGLRHARTTFDKAVERRKLSRRDADRKMALVSGGLEWSGFATADAVVEAVVERLDVKRQVLAELEARVPERCVLATNTSSLRVDALADALERPERLGGLHFFNPVHRMPLVEVVRGTATDDGTVATLHALARTLGKVPVVVADGPGFLVNRILGPYLNEAGWLLADGATVEEVDGAARDFGMPMGPLRLVDEVGIDVAHHAGAALHEALGERLAPSPVLTALFATGRLGRKGGAGFYRYEDGREAGVDPTVWEELGETVPEERPGVGRDPVRRRLLVQMVNEAARCLEEGIVGAAWQVDLALVMGTGFPPFRGGLLRFADSLHPRAVLDRTRALEEAHGLRFTPAPLLVELARDGRRFYEAFGGGTAA
jgi:3-hydroxyacyl-CoA dehydrogenase/enoyl-CoA hydratase/3-hydroxybutyryl-CoA epimerase